LERLKTVNISSSYGRKKVLYDVNIKADKGECVALVGVNGCGKTTLLNILSGLRTAYKGEVYFDGKKADKGLFRSYVGYVPQENNLIPELSVIDNLRLWYSDREVLLKELKAGELFGLGIDKMCSLKVKELSGGMKKRVSIGCALAGKPPILVLDEPGAALDLPGKAEIRQYIETYRNNTGTVILATHDEADLDLCDRIYAISNGSCMEIDRSLRGEQLMEKICKEKKSGRKK
jgi:ABC-type multidrug transport system ATPase subunit